MEQQGEAVHAVAQSGRFRAVIEDVAEMTATAPAVNLGTSHAEGGILAFADRILKRLIETRPSGAAFEFGLRGKQRQVAAGAGEGALAMFLEQRARARTL